MASGWSGFLPQSEEDMLNILMDAATKGVSKISIEDVKNCDVEKCCDAVKKLWSNDDYKKNPSLTTVSKLVNGAARIYLEQVQELEDEMEAFRREMYTTKKERREALVDSQPTSRVVPKKKRKKKKKPHTFIDDDFPLGMLNLNVEEELRNSPNVAREQDITLEEVVLPSSKRSQEHFSDFASFDKEISTNLEIVAPAGPVPETSPAIRQMEILDDVLLMPPPPPPQVETIPKVLPPKKKQTNLALNFSSPRPRKVAVRINKCHKDDFIKLVFKFDADQLPERNYPVEIKDFPDDEALGLWNIERPQTEKISTDAAEQNIDRSEPSASLGLGPIPEPSRSSGQIDEIRHGDHSTPRETSDFPVYLPIYQSTPLAIPEIEFQTDNVTEVVIPDLDNEEKIKLRRNEILRVVKSWSNSREITLEDVAQKPLTKRTVANAFYDILVLCKFRFLNLILHENSIELKSIEKGPKLM